MFLYIPVLLCKISPLLWRHPNPSDHDLNKRESKLSDDAFTLVTAFLAQWFL